MNKSGSEKDLEEWTNYKVDGEDILSNDAHQTNKKIMKLLVGSFVLLGLMIAGVVFGNMITNDVKLSQINVSVIEGSSKVAEVLKRTPITQYVPDCQTFLNYLQQEKNAGNNEIVNNYMLTNNISCTRDQTTNLTKTATYFRGSLIGSGNSITIDLYFNDSAITTVRYLGLFPILDGGSVFNLVLRGNITIAKTNSDNLFIGGLFGGVKNGGFISNIAINNLLISVPNQYLYTTFYVGGLIGGSTNGNLASSISSNLTVIGVFGNPNFQFAWAASRPNSTAANDGASAVWNIGGIIGYLNNTGCKTLLFQNVLINPNFGQTSYPNNKYVGGAFGRFFGMDSCANVSTISDFVIKLSGSTNEYKVGYFSSDAGSNIGILTQFYSRCIKTYMMKATTTTENKGFCIYSLVDSYSSFDAYSFTNSNLWCLGTTTIGFKINGLCYYVV